MENKIEYWEDEEYKEAVKGYSEYNQRCSMLNEFDSNNRSCFNKRDEYALKMNLIKEKYKQN
jgi:hypothetical protein